MKDLGFHGFHVFSPNYGAIYSTKYRKRLKCGGWGEGLFIARCEEKGKGPLLPPSRACLARMPRVRASSSGLTHSQTSPFKGGGT